MLQLKPLLSTFLRCEVRNGTVAAFWWDSWTTLGPLIDFVGQNGPRMLRLPLDAKVVNAVRDGNWYLSSARSEAVQTLQILLTTLSVPEEESGTDVFMWRLPSGRYSTSFSSRGTWDQIREVGPLVPWSKTVWFNESIPRASFFLWLAIRKRLPTRDRLISWGMSVLENCPLCNSSQETHDHLFFSCPFSDWLWQFFATRVSGQNSPSLLATVLDVMLQPPISVSGHTTVIMKLLLQVIVYTLWRERNARIFTTTVTPWSALKDAVDRTLRDRLLSFPAQDQSPSLLESYFQCISYPL